MADGLLMTIFRAVFITRAHQIQTERRLHLIRFLTEAYIQTVGDSYLNAVKSMVERHSNYKIESNKVILEEIKRNLKEDK